MSNEAGQGTITMAAEAGQLELNAFEPVVFFTLFLELDSLREAVRKTELLMRHSPTTYLEVLTAQQSLLAAEQAEAQDRFDEIAGVIALYHALGGGL